MINLVPAYGRDYKSKGAVAQDLEGGRDFIVADMSSPWDGKACNIDSLKQAKINRVTIRYGNLRKVAVFSV